MRNAAFVSLALTLLLPVPAADADSWGWVGMVGTDSLVPIHLDSGQPLLVFYGGFETGDTSRWSATVP